MITYKHGSNIFDSQCQVLVNTVNCKGVMGAGLAKQFKQRYPEMFIEYKVWCKHNPKPGKLMWWFEPTDLFSNKSHIICNFPTKDDWQYPSKLEYIEAGLETFIEEAKIYHIKSVAFPKLGCTNGKLNWEDVKPLMEKYLTQISYGLDIEIYV